jgi:hypothetical protein
VSEPRPNDPSTRDRETGAPGTEGNRASKNGIVAFLRTRPRARKTLLRVAAAGVVVGAVAWW